MLPAEILRELQALAARVGLDVRAESFDLKVIEGRGGLCWLRGRPVVLMDAGLPILDKIGVLADALAAFNLEAIYLPAPIRATLARRAAAKSARLRKAG